MRNTAIKKSRSAGAGKPFQPAIGTDIGTVEDFDAKTRGFLTKVIAFTVVTMVAFTGGYGIIIGNYTPVISVWTVAGPIVGALVV